MNDSTATPTGRRYTDDRSRSKALAAPADEDPVLAAAPPERHPEMNAAAASTGHCYPSEEPHR